jgi:DNA-binding SARP family transcriptional activator
MRQAEPAPQPIATLHLAGVAAVEVAGGAAIALAPRDAALLAWLVLEGPTPRTRLAHLLWPESAPEAARNALRQRLFQLKKQHGVDLVQGTAVLALAEGIAHDLFDADSVLGEAPHDFGAEYGLWLTQQRERRRARMRQSLVELCDMAEQAQDHADALSHAGELLTLEPLSEDAHRRVMRLHYLAGDRAAALLAFDRCEQVLKDEVGARPSAPTLALLDTIVASERLAAGPDRRLPAAVLRPPQLIGREAELRRAGAAWSAGQTVWIVGEAGMGKTRLLQEIVASQPGGLMVAARPGDAVVPYAALARLLRAVIERVPQALAAAPRADIARLLPEAAPALAAVPNAPGTTPAGRQLAAQRGAVELLRAAQAAGVAVLALDDLQFADDASLEMLAALAERDAVPGLAWAFAQRPADSESGERGNRGTALTQLHDLLLEAQRLQPLRLAALDAVELQALVESMALDGVDAPALALQLHRHTGGNPLFALETLRQAWVEGRASGIDALPRPVSVARLIERRLARLSAEAVRLARCAAVAGQDFSIELATAVLAVPVLDLADAWSELERAQVLRDGAFAHDLIFEAVLASVPQPIARHLHGQIAVFLHAHGGEPGRLALHWSEARQWAPAGAAFLRAAERAQHGVRVLDAAALLERAARAFERAGDDAARFDAWLRRAQLFIAFEFGDMALAAIDVLAGLAANEGQRLRVLEARLKLHEMRFESSAVLAQAPGAIAAARALGDVTLELGFAISLAYTLSGLRRADEAIALLEPYAATADALPTLDMRFDCWMAFAYALDYGDRLREALAAWERALAQPGLEERGDLVWQAVSNHSATLAKMGQVHASVEGAERALRMVLGGGEVPRVRAMQTQATVANRLRDVGRYGEALALLEQAHAAFEPAALGADLAFTEHGLTVIWQHLGQPERAQPLLSPARPNVHPGVTMMRLVHRADVLRQLGGDGLPLLREALRVIADPGDIYHRMAMLHATWFVPPDEGEALGASLAVWATARERFGVALSGHVRAAACGLALGAAARAQPHVEAALKLARTHQPYTFYLPELWLVAARVFQAVDQTDDARRAARAGHDWVMRVHDAHVPEAFRPSFLQRNAVNRELLALAPRLN